jgi:hypothetical protein
MANKLYGISTATAVKTLLVAVRWRCRCWRARNRTSASRP